MARFSTELKKRERKEESEKLLSNAIESAMDLKINDEMDFELAMIGHASSYWRSHALTTISDELRKQGNSEHSLKMMEDALYHAKREADLNWKGMGLNDIAFELSKRGKWLLVENATNEILGTATRQECWQQIGKEAYASKGYQEALQILPHFSSAEAQEHILQGITQALQVDAITKEVAHLALKLPAQKVQSMEHVMQVHAIHQLFFEELPSEKLERYNRTLNLQWAMDIKAQMKN